MFPNGDLLTLFIGVDMGLSFITTIKSKKIFIEKSYYHKNHYHSECNIYIYLYTYIFFFEASIHVYIYINVILKI